jgi:hypothetical protein
LLAPQGIRHDFGCIIAQPEIVDRNVESRAGFIDETRYSARNLTDLRRTLKRWSKRVTTHLLEKHHLYVAAGCGHCFHRHSEDFFRCR